MKTKLSLIKKVSHKLLIISLSTLDLQLKKIPKAKSSFQSYLNDQNTLSIILNPCDVGEITDIISSFGSGKASGPYSIPTNLLKEFSHHFSEPLSIIVNKSLQEGVFPQSVCAIYKKMTKLAVLTIDPFPFSLTSSKSLKELCITALSNFLMNPT